MIPKIIHYCWFGGNPLPPEAVRCIESWKQYCPDYEIREWNESNFDLNCCDYVREAYEAKKWAFVSDYARLLALTEQGGVYMDTDVEVLRPLDAFLEHRAFSGFEKEDSVPTGIMGCEKGFPLFKELLEQYGDRRFVLPDGSYNVTTNLVYFTELCLARGLRMDNNFQVVDGFALYPKDVFCPKSYTTGKIDLTDHTHTIHHFAGSWHSDKEKRWHAAEQKLQERWGNCAGRLMNFFGWRFVRSLYIRGLSDTIKKIKRGER